MGSNFCETLGGGGVGGGECSTVFLKLFSLEEAKSDIQVRYIFEFNSFIVSEAT